PGWSYPRDPLPRQLCHVNVAVVQLLQSGRPGEGGGRLSPLALGPQADSQEQYQEHRGPEPESRETHSITLASRRSDNISFNLSSRYRIMGREADISAILVIRPPASFWRLAMFPSRFCVMGLAVTLLLGCSGCTQNPSPPSRPETPSGST